MFKYNDGGRSKYFKGKAGDCVVRAIAIASQEDYLEVYNKLNNYIKTKTKDNKSSSRTGVSKNIIRRFLKSKNWKWVPTMFFGQGCKVHLDPKELPKGRLIVNVSRHIVAVIDGVINDTYDCSRKGRRCVYGYYIKEENNE